MTIQADAPEGKSAPDTLNAAQERPVKINPHAFFTGVQVGSADSVQAIVTAGQGKGPTDHSWQKIGEDFPEFAAKRSAGRKPAYFSMAAYDASKVERWKGRTVVNVLYLRGFWIDVDGGPEKWAKALERKDTNAVYETEAEITKAVRGWVKATGAIPNFLVQSGSGGMHLHYVLDAAIPYNIWRGRADALVSLARENGFKIDAQCTADAARIFRAPGSIHQSSGAEVQAYGWRSTPYTLDEFDALVKFDAATSSAAEKLPIGVGKYDLSVNGDVTGPLPKYSYIQASEKCAAMRIAAENDVPPDLSSA
jgi:hypothetical protein